MGIRTRLTVQGATLKGRWEDAKGGNSGPVELALAPRLILPRLFLRRVR